MEEQSTGGWGTYGGIPRQRIPWFPTIDAARCQPDRCELNCISWCQEQVYSRLQDGAVVVARPYACNVGDVSCSFQCPFDAISFPNKRALRDMLKAAREQTG